MATDPDGDRIGFDLAGATALERAVLGFVRWLASDSDSSFESVFKRLLEASGADLIVLDRVVSFRSPLVLTPEIWVVRDGLEYTPESFELRESDLQHRAFLDGEIWVVSDSHDPAAPDRDKYLELDPPVRSEVAIPIRVEGEPVAMLSLLMRERPHRWSADEVRALGAAAAVIEAYEARERAAMRLGEAVAESRRTARVNQALLACSQALLLKAGDDATAAAIEILREASGAMLVYVDENIDDEALGPCMRSLYWALRPGLSRESFIWQDELLPWSRLPDTYRLLSSGGVLCTECPADVSPVEGEFLTRMAHAQAELSVPIFVGGRWVASVGMYDDQPHRWADSHVQMLEAVAAMFGAYWTREKNEAELLDMLASRDQFVASVSHELRTPLAAVVGFASELRDAFEEFDEATRMDLIRLIARQAGDVSFLVDDLLVAARSQQARLSLQPSVLELAGEVNITLAGLPPEYASTVSVEVRQPVEILADGRRVRQVLRNLVVNAHKYGGPDCVIRVDRSGDDAIIEVRDNGSGIPMAMRSQVFDAYTSVGDNQGPLPSMGLGLTVSRQLAEAMGGSLTYRFDGWSVFELRLPGLPDPVG